MNILYLTDTLPYPTTAGGKYKTFRTLEIISKKHNITLVCFSDSKNIPTETFKVFKRLNIKLVTVYSKKRKFGYKTNFLEIIHSFLNLTPLLISNSYSLKMKQNIAKEIAKENYDLIQVDHLSMAQYLPKQKRCKWFYEEHNIEYLLAWENFVFTKKLFFLIESILLRFYEQKYINIFDKVLCISKKDKRSLTKFTNINNLVEYPLIIKNVRNNKRLFTGKIKLLFIGNLLWYPNYDAVNWFCQNILKKHPEIELDVIGETNSNINENLMHFPNCHLIGFINNLDQYINKDFYILVLPIHIAQGIRIKVLDTMAKGIPIIASAKSMYGLEVHKNVEYINAETAEEYIKGITLLINNPNKTDKLIINAQKYVERYHSKKQEKQILNLYI
jgi:glycosyltransferase involved in cell wall biosynthesis